MEQVEGDLSAVAAVSPLFFQWEIVVRIVDAASVPRPIHHVFGIEADQRGASSIV